VANQGVEAVFLALPCGPIAGDHSLGAYQRSAESTEHIQRVAARCLDAWRLKADAFLERLPSTGFETTPALIALSERGLGRLPATPAEDSNVTRAPAITAVTEAVTLDLLSSLRPAIVFPCPRVLHPEMPHLQHHGIDILAYECDPNGRHTLFAVEVMASVDQRHPPSTVGDHLTQLLDNTLNETSADRLVRDLSTVHDEAQTDEDRAVLNGFIVAAVDGSLSDTQSVVAMPVLLRRYGEFDNGDWKPFRDNTEGFEAARIPALIDGIALECGATFSGLLDEIKTALTEGLDESTLVGE